jgi:hypothetical protein
MWQHNVYYVCVTFSVVRYVGLQERESLGRVCSELAGSPFVNVKINGLGNFLEQSKLYTVTAFGLLKS